LALLAALSGSIGCARPGVNVEMSRWVGQPYARVLYAFGQPAQEKTLPDGRRLVTYEFPHTATIVNQFTNAADRLGATIQNAVGTVQVPRPAKELHWQTELSVEDACRDTWNWQSKNPDGYNK
jgi:hypothetical protein